jgi:hypothetical protein
MSDRVGRVEATPELISGNTWIPLLRLDVLVVSGQVLLSPGRWVIVLVPKVEALEPLGSLLDVMIRSCFRDGLGNDSPL